MATKALVILSGGQDSVTCLYWAKQHFGIVEAISFIYGQNHSIEIQQAALICRDENIRHTVVDVSFFADLGNSALTSNGNVNETVNGLPASFVPNRNALFITLAHAYAQKIKANDLVTGVCQTDYSGYPDCRHEFIHIIKVALNKGSNVEIEIHTPLMYKTKAQTFYLADELGALSKVIEYSHTCYNGNRSIRNEWGYGCGTCPACLLRAKGYSDFIAEYYPPLPF